jgi:hypothetical protein
MWKYPMGQFKARGGRTYKMSHLIATDLKELHRMARRLGVDKRHFQDKHSGPHYDIAMSKRKLAVEYGAVEVTMRELAAILWCQRNELPFRNPGHAYRRMIANYRNRVRVSDGTSSLGTTTKAVPARNR